MQQKYRHFVSEAQYDLAQKLRAPRKRRQQGVTAKEATKYLFVHIPKNAGVSIFDALSEPNVGHRLFCDIPRQEKERVEKIVFCTRDPFDRLLSTYLYFQRLHKTKPGWRRRLIHRVPPRFADLVMGDEIEGLVAHHYFFRSQYRYLFGISAFDDKLVRLRVANLEDDMQRQLGLSVPRLNAGTKSEKEAVFEPGEEAALRERVRHLYADDYRLLPELLGCDTL